MNFGKSIGDSSVCKCSCNISLVVCEYTCMDSVCVNVQSCVQVYNLGAEYWCAYINNFMHYMEFNVLFRGHCLLFSTGVWQEGDGQFKVDWASQAYCNYTIFVGVVLFIVSAIQVYRMSLYLYKGTDR